MEITKRCENDEIKSEQNAFEITWEQSSDGRLEHDLSPFCSRCRELFNNCNSMHRTLLSPGYKQKIALEILDKAAKEGCALCGLLWKPFKEHHHIPEVSKTKNKVWVHPSVYLHNPYFPWEFRGCWDVRSFEFSA
jgi:hypothetical protein